MVSHRSLSDSKSLQVSQALLSILTDLNSAVVWIVSTRPLISNSSSPCTNPLVTVPSLPITIAITVTFMFHSFFSFLARSKYLSLFYLSFNFTLWSAGMANSYTYFVRRFFTETWMTASSPVTPSRPETLYSERRGGYYPTVPTLPWRIFSASLVCR